MPKKRYKPIPLTGASKILRAHSTQIEPPGLYEMRDLYLSRSDNSMGLRSDWEPAYAGMFSYGSLIQGSDTEDYLNAAFYVDRAGHTIWFGRWAPFTWDGGAFGQLFTIYEEGTISTDSVRAEVEGQGTSWLQQVWPGCLIRQKGSGNALYVVSYVTSDTRIVTTEVMDGLSGAEYEIFRTHPANRAEWPIKMASLGGFLIYGTVDINQPLDERYISGPFYSNIGRPNLGVWFGTEPDLDASIVSMASISVGYDLGDYGGIQHSRLKHFAPIVIAGNLGSLFARNWIGDDLVITENNTQARERETYSVSSGTRNNITRIKAGQTSIEVLTLAGEIIQLDTEADNLGGSAKQYRYAPGSEISKVQPFGNISILGGVAGLYLGEGGLIGEDDGTTYTSGVDSTLRDGVRFQQGYLGTNYSVAVGDEDSTDGVILYWTDPASISRATTSVAESFLGVTYSVYLDRVIAVGTNGVCMTSDDQGATWDARSVGTTVDLNAVVSDAQGRCICAVGNADYGSAEAYLSLDGITWELVTGLGSDNLIDVTFNEIDGSFYAVSAGGAVYRIRRRVRIIPTGTDLGTFGEASDFVCDIQYDGTFFVAVGSKIWRSVDAITWSERLEPVETLTSVAYDPVGGDNWVAVGLSGTIYRSTDNGSNWTLVTSPSTVDLVGVIFHWVETTPDVAIDFIAIGKEGIVMRSNEGLGWSLMSFPVTSDLMSIASDTTNTTPNQRNLYISAGDGLLYVNNGNLGGYSGWEAWEDRVDKSYFPQEGRSPTQDRAMRKFNPRHYTSMAGIRFLGPARLVGTTYGHTATFEHLSSPGVGGVVFNLSNYITEAYIPFGDISKWHAVANQATGNSLALVGNGDFSPVIVQRLWSRDTSINGVFVRGVEGFLTTTDFGITWSTVPFQNYTIGDDTPYGLPQPLGISSYAYTAKGVSVSNRYWAPFCTDGVDFFLVQSSNFSSVKPRTIVLSGFEIGWEVEEVG